MNTEYGAMAACPDATSKRLKRSAPPGRRLWKKEVAARIGHSYLRRSLYTSPDPDGGQAGARHAPQSRRCDMPRLGMSHRRKHRKGSFGVCEGQPSSSWMIVTLPMPPLTFKLTRFVAVS